MLSDYNLLQPDDKRIKEVTDLGLAYNLLTNYTSFIAVDTEVRNKDGKATTVKQPLPLPQGVSDYAVGNGYAAASAPAPVMVRQKAVAGDYSGLAQEVMPEKKAERKDNAVTIKVAKVTSTGALAKGSVTKSAEQQMSSLLSCLPTTQHGATVTIKLTIDKSGAVNKIELASPEIKDKAVLQCLERIVKGWKFSANPAGKESTVEMTIQIGS